ncbi:hypothetical protein [Ochrobactrum sp. Marseille-Q0166]|uniref:hypothetical protein n=1 Tax=Ochrobactrum sp. Marseille-Q0166 TaxID=2761105 RepID=UPI001FFE50AB|nr:hypothetical protein [Ochrobactrum sp. Marseille-Q0166]
MTNFAIFDEHGFPEAFFSEEILGYKEIVISETPIYGEKPEATEDDPHPVAPVIGFTPVMGPNPDCRIPENAIRLTDEQWLEFINNAGLRKWNGSEVVVYDPPQVDPITILPAVTLWERMTEAEAKQVAEAMATQPFRTRKIFETAATFRSDHELWPLLDQIANELFGAERAAELLAP